MAIHSFIGSLTHSFTLSFTHSFIHLLIHSFISLLTHSLIHSLTHSRQAGIHLLKGQMRHPAQGLGSKFSRLQLVLEQKEG